MKPKKDINKAIKKNQEKHGPKPKPEWIEAILILLLHKTGGAFRVSIKSLNKFMELKTNNKTIFEISPDKKYVTLMAPEIQVKRIKVRKKKIITDLN